MNLDKKNTTPVLPTDDEEEDPYVPMDPEER